MDVCTTQPKTTAKLRLIESCKGGDVSQEMTSDLSGRWILIASSMCFASPDVNGTLRKFLPKISAFMYE